MDKMAAFRVNACANGVLRDLLVIIVAFSFIPKKTVAWATCLPHTTHTADLLCAVFDVFDVVSFQPIVC